MSQQEVLLSILRKKIKSQSLIDAVAVALNISYDAAHRRVSSKSKFSIDEAVILCRHYKISIDAILTGNNVVVVEKTKEISSFDDMQQYFAQSAGYLDAFSKKENVSLYYAAKDIPLFYTIGGTLLSKFKLYVWMDLLAGNGGKKFEEFTFTANVQQHVERIKSIYEGASVHEIWNDTTINSTLQQIFYFFESGLLSKANALVLYDDLETLLAGVEKKSAESNKFHLYYNELLILNNNVIVSAADKRTMFIPYTALGYFITEDETTCTKASEYFERQMKNSKSLNLSGTRDRKIFFNKAMRKIDFYKQKLSNPEELLV
ncbi:MAG: hypothetical protein EOO50_06495 [Flavobacterium sp.]|uniref:hypothetical protein n=1 Tax=Flavobacterium sp. TaxID=239 RepID=UPI00121A118F|nr:hypothetical protein [Flavobacterium sp.]RZJ67167.1 MAG: hypothetical protein EOO50_06495 [Flavobacterium sp.]